MKGKILSTAEVAPVDTASDSGEDSADSSKSGIETILDTYPNLESLLEVHLPVIAILAEKSMTLSNVLNLDVGSVIVFPKHNSDPIPLMVNNRQVGAGKTIKVGDHFGLHLRTYSQQAVVQAVM